MNFHKLLKPLNYLVLKRKNYIYAAPHINGKNDCYDLLNYSSDNLLCLVNYVLKNYKGKKITIYLEYFDPSRREVLEKYIKSFSNPCVNIRLIESYMSTGKNKIFVALANLFRRFKCRIWLTDTGFVHYFEKTKKQVLINLNYSTPLKSAMPFVKEQDFSNYDYYIETSLLTACVHSAEFRVKLDNCSIIGFPRNDTLFSNSKYLEIKRWIAKKTTFDYKYILVYAPTYRDYDGAFETNCIFGFEDSNNAIYDFLRDNGILVISKMHPMQKIYRSAYSDCVIEYEKNYNFSLYDLLSASDLLVSDYSSVIHDYVLTKKPIILDFFDDDIYSKKRGFAFEPLSYICPGPICKSESDFINALTEIINGKKASQKYCEVLNMFHRNVDGMSTERAFKLLEGLIR